MVSADKYSYIKTAKPTESWYHNLLQGSKNTAEVYVRGLGLYCELNHTTPERILEDAKSRKLRDDFVDFVSRMENKGYRGSYIARFKKVLNSLCAWKGTKGVMQGIKIRNASLADSVADESPPTQEEVAMMLRRAPMRTRAMIALAAFSGIRPEVIGNVDGSDGLRIRDIKDVKIKDNEVVYEKLPAVIAVRQELSKTRRRYLTMVPPEGTRYIADYLNWRMKRGEVLDGNSLVIKADDRANHLQHGGTLTTAMVRKRLKEAIVAAGFDYRPYVLRSYFASALDMCENKRIISHSWFQYWMGHKGDMSARYSTEKLLRTGVVEEMRGKFKECCKYIETEHREDDGTAQLKKVFRALVLITGHSEEEIQKMDIEKMTQEEINDVISKVKIPGEIVKDVDIPPIQRTEQKLVLNAEIQSYMDQGWKFIGSIPGENKTIMERKITGS